jgi:hypothetical protein
VEFKEDTQNKQLPFDLELEQFALKRSAFICITLTEMVQEFHKYTESSARTQGQHECDSFSYLPTTININQSVVYVINFGGKDNYNRDVEYTEGKYERF